MKKSKKVAHFGDDSHSDFLCRMAKPSFYASSCPVFAVAWLGGRTVFYSGGGGATRSGVSNKMVVATFVTKKEEEGSSPELKEMFSTETGDNICTTASASRSDDSIEMVVTGLGSSLVVYAVTKTGLLPVSDPVKVSDLTTVVFDRSGGNKVAAGDGSGVIRIFDLKNLAKVRSSLEATEVAEKSGEGKKCDSGVQEGNCDVSLGSVRLDVCFAVELRGHTESITALQFNSNSKRLCSSSKDGTCRIWDVSTGKEVCVLPTTSGLPQAYTKDKRVLKQMCRSCLWSPVDDEKVYTLQNAARGSSYVTKWALSFPESDASSEASFEPLCVGEICRSPVPCMDVRSDGKVIVAGDTGGNVHVVDANSLKKLNSYEAHQLPVSSISLVPVGGGDGATEEYDIVTGSGDKTLILGSSNSPQQVAALVYIAILILGLALFFYYSAFR